MLSSNYRPDPGAHSHTWTMDAVSQCAITLEDQPTTCFAGAQHLGGGYCHNPFPTLSPLLLIDTLCHLTDRVEALRDHVAHT